jgi:hypothetical protein
LSTGANLFCIPICIVPHEKNKYIETFDGQLVLSGVNTDRIDLEGDIHEATKKRWCRWSLFQAHEVQCLVASAA